MTCISTRTWPAATHTPFSFSGHPQPQQGLLLLSSGWHLRLLHPGRIEWLWSKISGNSNSTSATVLSCPFWNSNQKLNFARAPTHQWPVASKLGVVIIYIKGLLSVLTVTHWEIQVFRWIGVMWAIRSTWPNYSALSFLVLPVGTKCPINPSCVRFILLPLEHKMPP